MSELLKKHSDSPGVLIQPPLLFAAGFLIGLALDYWAGVSFALGDALKIGYLLIVGGVALAVWGIWHMRAAKTNVPTHMPVTALVTTGPFQNTRNPLYIAAAIVYLGLASVLDAPLAMLMLVPVLMVLHVGVVLREEAYLEKKFGEAYRDYAARTKRYF